MATIPPSNPRGMGWRKPVPAFIPTPPTSRPTSETWFKSAPVVSGGNANADKGPTATSPGDSPSPSRQPPMPDNWLNIVRSVSHDFYGDSNHFHRSPGLGNPERQQVYVELTRAASSMDDHRPPSRFHYTHRGASPRTYRPPTPPIPSVRRPRSCAIPSMLEQQTSLGRPYRMIYPDPPSLLMKETSRQTLRHSPPPSLCVSESTRKPTSIKTKPSLQSLTSSGHTAVSSHVDIGSWYIPDDLRPEWSLGVVLDRYNEKQMIAVGRETKGNPELPMHYVPVSKLKRKQQKQRSCTDMLWNTMASAGRAIASLFKSDPVESGSMISVSK